MATHAVIVYITDDDADVRLVQRALSRRGDLEFVTAADVASGLVATAASPPSLVLFDLDAPGAGARDAFAKLRADGAARGVPVVVITADPSAGEEAVSGGAASYVTKPIDLNQLDTQISAALVSAPLAEGSSPNFAMGDGATPSGAPDNSKIVIADDNPQIRSLLQRGLGMSGYEVVAAEDGTTALELVRQHMPALAVLDWEMPGLEGDEVCRRIKSDPATAGIHVIVLTGRTLQQDVETAIRGGADDYLTKPFDLLELEVLVEKVCPPPNPRV